MFQCIKRVCIILSLCMFSYSAIAGQHVVKAGAREFKPHTIYIEPGDSVQFSNMTSHNAVPIEDLIPEGVEPWESAMGENVSVTFDVPGIYSYVCQPHIGFGMVGVIVVGSISVDALEEYKQKAQDTLKGPYRRLLGKINKIKPTEK